MAFLIPSSGIGRSVAILYAREGADVTIVYLPEEQEDADETKSLVEKEGRQCLTIPFDLKDLKNIDKIVQKHIEKFGALDIVVNNASRQLMCKNFEEIDLGM
jgi:NAD(P)-dependent dehydrogenase (short-subunit alcohol dehydrogenase family)